MKQSAIVFHTGLTHLILTACLLTICLPLIIVSPSVRRTGLKSSQLNWERSFPFWQWYAHVTVRSCWAIVHWRLFAGGDVIIPALFCNSHHSTWTQRQHLRLWHWGLFMMTGQQAVHRSHRKYEHATLHTNMLWELLWAIFFTDDKCHRNVVSVSKLKD